MTIVDHHNEYQLPELPTIHKRQAWDGLEYEYLINDALAILFPEQNMKINEDQLTDVMNKNVFDKFTAKPYFPIESPYVNLHVLSSNETQFKILANLIADDLKIKCIELGGDDDYYDYFPTYVEMFLQICKELKLRELFESTIEYILHAIDERDYVGPNDESYRENICADWPDEN